MTIDDYDSLSDLVDQDKKDHGVKEMANLFLNAMYDWPTPNQSKIHDFANELKEFFGTPLTIQGINGKPINLNIEHNTWRHEAGASIVKMIDLSKKD